MSVNFTEANVGKVPTSGQFRSEVCFASISRCFGKFGVNKRLWFRAPRPRVTKKQWPYFKQIVNGLGFDRFIETWDDDLQAASIIAPDKIGTLQAFMVGSVFRMTTESDYQTDLLFYLHAKFVAPAIVKLYMCQVAAKYGSSAKLVRFNGGHNMMNCDTGTVLGVLTNTPEKPVAHPVELEKLRFARLAPSVCRATLNDSSEHIHRRKGVPDGNAYGSLSHQWWNYRGSLVDMNLREREAMVESHPMHKEWRDLEVGTQTLRQRFEGERQMSLTEADILKMMDFIARAMKFKTKVRMRANPIKGIA